jgi:hypothetical protein
MKLGLVLKSLRNSLNSGKSEISVFLMVVKDCRCRGG